MRRADVCRGRLGAVALLAALGCSPTTAPRADPAPASSPREPERTSHGEVAGVRYLEQLTGGARPDERVPMIVALHPMGGDPADLVPLFRDYQRRARVIVPYGHPSGGLYIWYDAVGDDVAAPVITREVDRLVGALAALVVARPTVGKPLVTGFSQGGFMTFALAVTQPDAIAGAFPIGGLLPLALYPSAALSSTPRPATLPPIAAFHGADDRAVPLASARASIAEVQRAGYAATLREYAGVAHTIADDEARDVLEAIGRAADQLTDAAQ